MLPEILVSRPVGALRVVPRCPYVVSLLHTRAPHVAIVSEPFRISNLTFSSILGRVGVDFSKGGDSRLTENSAKIRNFHQNIDFCAL